MLSGEELAINIHIVELKVLEYVFKLFAEDQELFNDLVIKTADFVNAKFVFYIQCKIAQYLFVYL